MLKIHQHKNTKGLIKYFDEDFAYGGGEPDPLKREQSREQAGLMPSWHGRASEFLQLPKTVTKPAFTSLASNLHPVTKEQLTPRMRHDRIVAYDLTFSLPKGVSLLYAIAGHSDIINASKRAVIATMAEAEHHMRVRVRDGGPRDDRLTKNLTYAFFPHRLARPQDGVADPQLHAHAVVFNTTRDHDERTWKAGKFFFIAKNMAYLQNVFHRSMRREMELLGYRTAPKGNFWDLQDVPVGLVEKFSSRRNAIRAELAKLDSQSPALAASIALFYREHKGTGIGGQDLWNAWTRRLTKTEWDWLSGYKPDAARARDLDLLKDSVTDRKLAELAPEDEIRPGSQGPIDRDAEDARGRVKTDQTSRGKDRASRSAENGQAFSAADDGPSGDAPGGGTEPSIKFESVPPSRRRLSPSTSLRALVRFAAAQVFDRIAVVTELDLIKHVMSLSASPDLLVADVRRELDKLPYERRELGGKLLYVDPAELSEERRLVQKVVSGRGQFGPLIPAGLLGANVAPKSFSKSMRDAFAKVAASNDLVTLVEAFPGEASREFLSLLRPRLPVGPVVDIAGVMSLSGKSRAQALTPALRVGYVVLSPNGVAASEGLREAGVVAPATVGKFIANLGVRNDARGGVVIVDQAHLLTTRDANSLIDAAKDIRARVVLMSSESQMRAVGPGNVPRLLMESAGLTPAFTGVPASQKSPVREPLSLAAHGKSGQALDKLVSNGHALEVEDSALHAAAAAEYLRGSSSSRWKPTKAVIVVPSRSECDTMNDAVRDGMKSRKLIGKGKGREQLQSLGLSEAAKRRSDSYQSGMVVEFNENATRKLLGIPLSRTYKVGQQWTVEGRVSDGVVIRRGTRTGVLPREHADKFDVFQRRKQELSAGDAIRFTRSTKARSNTEYLANKTFGAFKVPRHAVDAGRSYRVTGFTRRGDAKLSNGRVMPKDWCHWVHDYARTPRDVQGIQRERVVFASRGETGNEVLGRGLVTALSATKKSFQVVTDNLEALRGAVDRDSRRINALEVEQRIVPPSAGLGPNGPRRGDRGERESDRSQRKDRGRGFERE